MITVSANQDGLPVFTASIQGGVAGYLDNDSLLDLAKGDPARRERFIQALIGARGSLLFSVTNAAELSGPQGHSADAAVDFLNGFGRHWLPVELNAWTVKAREIEGAQSGTACVSQTFVRAYFQDRANTLSPDGTNVIDLSPDFFWRLGEVVKWGASHRDEVQKHARDMDDALFTLIHGLSGDASALDRVAPAVPFDPQRPATFVLNHLVRVLVDEAKSYHLKKGDGLDFCHAVVGVAYGSFATLDRQWKRRILRLPQPNRVAKVYYRTELDHLVADLEADAEKYADHA